jgi:uncharacterized protein with PQ loop repeat
MQNLGRHHQHVRRRVHEGLEPYPHPSFFVRTLDQVIYVVAFLGPAFTLPQVYQIWASGQAAGVSVFSWVSYAAFDVVWVLYAVVHRDRALIFSNVLWFLVNFTVAVEAVLYR